MVKHKPSNSTLSTRRRVSISPIRLMLTLNLLLVMLGALVLAYTFNQSQPLSLSHALARNVSLRQTIQLQPSPIASLPPLVPLFHGNLHLPEIALTFDDGPNPYFTPQILAILQRFKIQATFFCIGQMVVRYPTIVSQEDMNGNLVEDHTWSHPHLRLLAATAIYQQVEKGKQAIQQVTGETPTFFVWRGHPCQHSPGQAA